MGNALAPERIHPDPIAHNNTKPLLWRDILRIKFASTNVIIHRIHYTEYLSPTRWLGRRVHSRGDPCGRPLALHAPWSPSGLACPLVALWPCMPLCRPLALHASLSPSGLACPLVALWPCMPPGRPLALHAPWSPIAGVSSLPHNYILRMATQTGYPAFGLTISIGNFVAPSTRSVTLPITRRCMPPRPCVAIAIRSQPVNS